VDRIQNRFGRGRITRAIELARRRRNP